MSTQSSLTLTWQDAETNEGRFVRFDVVSTESHAAVMSITTHPVEKGANVTDHANEESNKVTIEAFVSNKPIYSNPGVEEIMDYSFVELDIPEKQGGAPLLSPGGLTQAVTGAVRSLFGEPPKRAIVLKPRGDMPDRARKIYELLEAARTQRALVRVSTRLRDVENMLIESVTVNRTPDSSGGLPFQVDLRQVTIVESETVDAPVPAEARGALEKAKGSRAGEDDKKKEQKLKSIAAGTFDGAAGLLGGLTGGLP